MSEEDFEPRLGKIRGRTPKTGKRYTHQLLAAINRAGGKSRRRGFKGKRIGQGGGIGAILGSRDSFAAFRQRRVIVKARIVKLAGKGMGNAKAHLRLSSAMV